MINIIGNVAYEQQHMKKRYLKPPLSNKELIRGAYDKGGKWWYEDDINTFTGGMIKICFGKDREQIKIIERIK